MRRDRRQDPRLDITDREAVAHASALDHTRERHRTLHHRRDRRETSPLKRSLDIIRAATPRPCERIMLKKHDVTRIARTEIGKYERTEGARGCGRVCVGVELRPDGCVHVGERPFPRHDAQVLLAAQRRECHPVRRRPELPAVKHPVRVERNTPSIQLPIRK